MKTGESKNIGDVERLNRELTSMRRELDDVKEIIRGLIKVIMSKEGEMEEDEFN
ncbi:MAG: hypothetical protein ACP5NK_05060 [Thermoplasmata archaeon]